MRRSEMKRTGFFKGMLDGLRSSVSQPVKSEAEVEENLRPDQFQVAKTVRHGFPYQPTAMAFDPVQRLLAIGTKNGALRIFGRPGVDCFVQHILECAIIQIIFLINEGALITVCSDDSLHLWNLRQKKPEIVHTLKFQKERITYCALPFQSKWLYIGTERGNVHVVNVESFLLSGYVINWNKAIELSRKTHPGSVIHLSDNPIDPNKLLIGFECGQIVLWDLRNRAADLRCMSSEPLKSVSWHNEGKQFMCSHTDGSLTTWNIRAPQKPFSTMYPHAKPGKDGKPEPCKCIYKVEWKTVRAADSFVIFSGGLPVDKGGKTPSLTVINGKTTTVLEMEHNIIDFITLCESPYQSVEFQDPYAIVVLLYNDLVVVDLTSAGYPCFQNPYPMDLHESPVTFCTYLADCPTDLIPAFYSVGCKTSKRAGFSEKEWPINGGEWGTGTVSYPEIIITGHADGTLKFWDASAVSLQVLYKLKTAKVFEKPKAKSFDGQEEDPFALEKVAFCPESRVLCIAGASSHVVLFRFCRQEATAEVPKLDIPIVYEIDDEPDCSPECEYPPRPNLGQASQQGSFSSATEETRKPIGDYYVPLKVKSGPIKKSAGFQAELVCLTPWLNGEPPGHITALKLNSSYGLMAYGNECGLAVVDIVQKVCLLNMGTPDLYGSSDPYQRIPRSPKKNAMGNNENNNNNEQDRCRSPTTDQVDSVEAILPQPRVTMSECEIDPKTGSTFYVPIPTESVPPIEPTAAPPLPEPITAAPLPPPRTKRRTYKSKEREKHKSSNEDSNKIEETSIPPQPLPAAEELGLTQPPELGLVENGGQDVVVVQEEVVNPEVAEEAIDVCYWPKAEGAAMSSAKRNSVVSKKEYDRQKSSDSLVTGAKSDNDSQVDGGVKLRGMRRNSRKFSIKCKSRLIDLRDDNGGGNSLISPVGKIFKSKEQLRIPSTDKIDSSFSRSRSSSMSSLENISSEAIQCLTFCDSYTRKGDPSASPSLWVGTSLGSVLVIILTIPGGIESRQTQPVIVSPSGSIFRLKGSIQSISFLDCNGALVPCLFEPWRDCNTPEKRIKTPSGNPQKTRVSPTSSSDIRDTQYVVMTSEKQVRVVSLPSQTSMYKMPLTETSFVVASEVVSIKDSVCLACYIGNGNIVVYSLPSLKLLIEVDFLPLMDIRIARTFCFSNNGHGMYLCSPSELQKFTISANFCENLQEMMSTIFLTKEMPEAPKQGFFKGLFGGGPSSLDREELFGEASGKASKSVARFIPGNTNSVEYLKGQSSTLASELMKARQGLTERGEQLNLLEERTARMMTEAESFANASHQLMAKYRDKKWYQF